MKRVCIFPHYYDLEEIPIYVKIYVTELSNYFDEIIIVTNRRQIENRIEIESDKINILEVDNEGYDFGMFYKGYQTIKDQDFDTVACINDSNIVFGSLKALFDWGFNQNIDFWGLADANIKPPFSTHAENYHVQSHFLVFNKQAINYFDEYFEQLDITQIFSLTDQKATKRRIINDWEIGVSQFLLSKKLKAKAYFQYNQFDLSAFAKNPAFNLPLDLFPQIIKRGLPIIKKRIITSAKPKDYLNFRNNWRYLIKKYGNPTWNIDQLLVELKQIRNRHFLNKIRKII